MSAAAARPNKVAYMAVGGFGIAQGLPNRLGNGMTAPFGGVTTLEVP
jgi:hypothetical protein